MKKIILFALIFLTACSTPQTTITPEVTVTPLPTETQTPEPFFTTEELATMFAYETKIAEYPSVCSEPTLPKFSPNGLWREEFCVSEIDNKLALTVSNRETKVLWKMFFIDYVPSSEVKSEGRMAILHWSNDGNYVFFNSYSTGAGGACFVRRSTQDGWGLFRLDLQTGQVAEILPIVKDRHVYYGFSISPTDRRLVYGLFLENLKILDITTGKSINVINKKEFDERGGYIWSQDGLKFIYSTVKYSPDYAKKDYTVRLVDGKTGIEQILLESPQDCLRVVEWTDTNVLKIEKNYDESLIRFDLNTNSIISETSTTP